MSYATWRNQTIGQRIDIDHTGDFDCTDIPKTWAVYLFGNWTTTLGYGNAKDIYANANPKYWQKIPNDKSNANQLPQQGDVMVFGPTPAAGYTNQYDNPYGHTGVVDSATSSGYTIIQQASGTNAAASARYWAWKYRPCIGWLRPIPQVSTPQGGDMLTRQNIIDEYQVNRGAAPSEAEIAAHLNGGTWASLSLGFKTENAARRAAADKAVKDVQALLSTKTKELETSEYANTDLKRTITGQQTQIGELNKYKQVQAKEIGKLQNLLVTHGGEATITVKQAVQVLVRAFKDWIK
jgi:hypothetical protein